MKRREFITKTAVGSAFVGLGGATLASCAGNSKKHITILHTNDVHSHIDPFPADHAQFPGMGGVAKRATLIEQIRQENPHTLLLDAGDIFQGTPFFNFYGGELEFKLMDMLGYHASTIGNHDFDNGIDGLFAQMPNAKFDMICANYDFSNTVMDGLVKPYSIYTVDGVRIGVYGLGIALDGLVSKKLYKETQYIDPYKVAADMERTLKETEKCDLVLCLSHLGYDYAESGKPNDLGLAMRTEHTDLIIGGHTHTFLDKPTIVPNKTGRNILVNQVGCYGVNVGRIDFYLDSDAQTSVKGASITV